MSVPINSCGVSSALHASRSQRVWRRFCQFLVRVFYRRCEVQGLERLPVDQAVLLCANHASALVDPVIIQAVLPRVVHPLARSGLFQNWLMRPVLALLQAVPVYRRQDGDGDTSRNEDSFRRCYELFEARGVLLIFPEGQSHSDPGLRPIKTGAARMVLGSRTAHGRAPVVLPVGLTFTSKGRFRGSVLVSIGEPVPTDLAEVTDPEQATADLNARIEAAMRALVLNADSWEEVDLSRRLERFFALRRGRYRRGTLAQRVRVLQRLIRAHHQLYRSVPEQIERVRRRLRLFDRLCERFGICDYHLTVRYRPLLVAGFVLHSLVFLVQVLPVALWGALNNAPAYLLTGVTAARLARASDQHETAKLLMGLLWFPIGWALQTALVWQWLEPVWALAYLASLPVTGAVALLLHRERRRLVENSKVFFLFLRRRRLRQYMENRRRELEHDLATLLRLAKRQSRAGSPGA